MGHMAERNVERSMFAPKSLEDALNDVLGTEDMSQSHNLQCGQLKFCWSSEGIGILLSAIAPHMKRLNNRRVKRLEVWKDIFSAVSAQISSVTLKQCVIKWKNLKRSYINYEKFRRKPNSRRMYEPLGYDQLCTLIGDSWQIQNPDTECDDASSASDFLKISMETENLSTEEKSGRSLAFPTEELSEFEENPESPLSRVSHSKSEKLGSLSRKRKIRTRPTTTSRLHESQEHDTLYTVIGDGQTIKTPVTVSCGLEVLMPTPEASSSDLLRHSVGAEKPSTSEEPGRCPASPTEDLSGFELNHESPPSRMSQSRSEKLESPLQKRRIIRIKPTHSQRMEDIHAKVLQEAKLTEKKLDRFQEKYLEIKRNFSEQYMKEMRKFISESLANQKECIEIEKKKLELMERRLSADK